MSKQTIIVARKTLVDDAGQHFRAYVSQEPDLAVVAVFNRKSGINAFILPASDQNLVTFDRLSKEFPKDRHLEHDWQIENYSSFSRALYAAEHSWFSFPYERSVSTAVYLSPSTRSNVGGHCLVVSKSALAEFVNAADFDRFKWFSMYEKFAKCSEMSADDMITAHGQILTPSAR